MPLKHLKHEDATAEELIRAIEKKDRRFRLFQSLFMIGTFCALIVIIGAQQRTLDGVQTQVAEDQKIAAQTRKERTEQLNDITRRLNCMVVFFSTPDREGLTIENVNECTLNRNENLNKFFEDEPNNSSENPPNLPGSATTAPQENAAAPVPQNPQIENPNPETPPAEERPPLTLQTPIIDIPLCVPLLDVCAR
jgi:hypothetical protein